MSILQDEINRASDKLELTPGEYEGPLIIDKPISIEGHHSTIWVSSGPAVVVNSPSVSLRNLRIEITGGGNEDNSNVSLCLNTGDTVLEHVEVTGKVKGIEGESEEWTAPTVIALGDFAANKENSFSIGVESPADAELVCNIKGVEITPEKLKQGKNKLYIKTAGMRDNTILFGELLLKTHVSRRIYLTGKSVKGAVEHLAEPPVSGSLPISIPVQVDPPDDVIAPAVPEDSAVTTVRRGQRVSANELQSTELKIVYEHASSTKPIDIDPYVFLLGKNNKARKDEDLVFFGNAATSDNSVRVNDQDVPAVVTIEFDRVASDIEKIVVVYSIYDERDSGDFSCVKNPVVRVLSNNKEKYRMPLDNLTTEKTLVAIEIYRYKGEWKLNFVGGGYISGLPRLCNEYGLSVE